MPGRVLACLAGLLPLLAGCLAPAGPAEPPSSAPAPAGYAYACGGGLAADPCPVRLERTPGGYEEPYAAVHPGDPRTLVVGANHRQPVAEGLATRTICGVALLVSTDGGAAWEERRAPVPRHPDQGPGDLPCARDPALLLDPDGTLHLTGMVWFVPGTSLLPGLPPPAPDPLPEPRLDARVFYARSPDLGATWADVQVLDPATPQQDRNWVARDPGGALVVTWAYEAEDPPRAALAWSRDGGATWDLLPPAARPPCGGNPPLRRHGDALVLACVAPDGKGLTQAWAVDAAAGALRPRDAPRFPGWAELVPLGGARWAALEARSTGDSFFDQEALAAWSADGGATWSAPAPLAALVPGAWERSAATWAEPDPQGTLHVLLWVGAGSDEETHHLALAPGGAPVHAARLASWSRAEEPEHHRLRSYPLTRGDGHDYNGAAWDAAAGRGLLALTPGFGAAYEPVVLVQQVMPRAAPAQTS